MYPFVKKVEAHEDYTLSIEFDNGEQGVLDMKEYLDFGIFERLKDCQAFQRIKVPFDTVEWESGLDLDPEFIYQQCCKHPPQRNAQGA